MRKLATVRRLAAPILALGLAAPAVGAVAVDPAEWPAEQRAFLQDGPALLVPAAEREGMLAGGEDERRLRITELLADRSPATPANELVEAIERRRQVASGLVDSPLDLRWQVVFLHGAPGERTFVECANVFRALEVWSYASAAEPAPRYVLFVQSRPRLPWRIWTPPGDEKRQLYEYRMENLMQVWEEQEGKRFSAERFDFQLCRGHAELLDRVTGVWALTERRRPPKVLPSPLDPPADLDAWARSALEASVPSAPGPLADGEVTFQFPERQGSERIVTRATITLPAPSGVTIDTTGEHAEIRLELRAVVEQEGEVFDRLRMRFQLPPPAPGVPLTLAAEMPLRPGRLYLLRLHLRDEVGGGEARLVRVVRVAAEPQPVTDLPVPEGEMVTLAEELERRPSAGADALLLVPPPDVVSGLWRAEAIVAGERIVKVVFSLDGRPQAAVGRPPFGVELALEREPREHLVRAEGYDAGGMLLASAELAINEPHGSLRVRIAEPRAGAAAQGRTLVRARLVVPEGRRVDRVEVQMGEAVVCTRREPPWECWIDVPAGSAGPTYVTATAVLDSGERAEDVRVLGGVATVEQTDVDLVELYTAVVDGSGRPVPGALGAADFEILEDGRPQRIRQVEVAANLPLVVGLAMDVSSSMHDRMREAKSAAAGFLTQVLRPGDEVFALTFADHPLVLQGPTRDLRAVADLLGGVRAYGNTALHDALVSSLYLFRGFRGQRALVVISDGDDSASKTAFRQALEYARRSGVAIYAVGIDVDRFSWSIRRKLSELATETGGRAFFVRRADELEGVYRQIDVELRTRYLVTYVSNAPAGASAYRGVEVKVRKGALRARTIRGYFP